MKKYFTENLNVLQNPDQISNAAKQAKKLGLKYVGFGRYEDPKIQQITHVIVNDSLSPFNKAIKTNTFKTQQIDDFGTYNELMQPQIDQLHSALIQGYPPEKYDDKELESLNIFTSGGYIDINNRLSNLPINIAANKIEPQSIDDSMSEMIESLDSAIKKSRAPFDFQTYIKLGHDVDLNQFNLSVGSTFKFKGFRTSSLNVSNVIKSSENNNINPQTGRNTVILLQLNILKNTKGIYVSDFSATPLDYEFILPRAAKIQITSDFQKIVGSDASTNNLNLEVHYADCSVK